MRCTHEASLHEKNCFITLTYNDEKIPVDRSLDKTHFQKFMKRLRKKTGEKIRYYQCGEYGENFGRPHYHALLFGYDFPDKKLYKHSGEYPLWISSSLDSIWGLGFCNIGSVNFESAAYVARYVMKKITGAAAPAHYKNKIPEYSTMSRGGRGRGSGGIGTGWYEKFKDEVYPDDEIIVRGKKVKPPRAYDRLLEKAAAGVYEAVKESRRREALAFHSDMFELAIKEEVKIASMRGIQRNKLK